MVDPELFFSGLLGQDVFDAFESGIGQVLGWEHNPDNGVFVLDIGCEQITFQTSSLDATEVELPLILAYQVTDGTLCVYIARRRERT